MSRCRGGGRRTLDTRRSLGTSPSCSSLSRFARSFRFFALRERQVHVSSCDEPHQSRDSNEESSLGLVETHLLYAFVDLLD